MDRRIIAKLNRSNGFAAIVKQANDLNISVIETIKTALSEEDYAQVWKISTE